MNYNKWELAVFTGSGRPAGEDVKEFRCKYMEDTSERGTGQ